MSEARDAVLRQRFMLPHETYENEVWDRVARAWSDNDAQREQFYNMMVEKRAFPNTPAIANAGKPNQCGSACFVLPIEDSLTKGDASIAGTLMDATAVHQYGGGTGFSLGRIRPEGALVSTTGRDAPGPVSFLRGYSDWFKRVSQAGLRPAANMAILPVDHPDILKFITCKATEGDIPNFNISVALTDDFMRDVVDGNLEEPEELDIWEAIIDGAWRNGEPGAFFVDTVNKTSLHPELIEATNPCGEVPLLPYEACVLGSVNLAAHLKPTGDYVGVFDPGYPGYTVDWDALEKTVRTLTVMLDNIVEKQDYPLPIIRETHHRYRKIGVGVMGFADALTMMGYAYGEVGSISLAENWMRFIQQTTYDESARIADEKGKYSGWYNVPGTPTRRNLCCQVIAPTGTISRLAECSFGIEPNYAAEYESFILGSQFHERHPLADHPKFVTADSVTPAQHIRVQAAFQRFTDQAVSKTVNLPHTATREDVAAIYRQAWESGCKGITVYREKSRVDAVIVPDCKDGTCAL